MVIGHSQLVVYLCSVCILLICRCITCMCFAPSCLALLPCFLRSRVHTRPMLCCGGFRAVLGPLLRFHVSRAQRATWLSSLLTFLLCNELLHPPREQRRRACAPCVPVRAMCALLPPWCLFATGACTCNNKRGCGRVCHKAKLLGLP